MSAFDKIIGYDNIKEEMMQICEMIRDEEKRYEKMGAKLPKGIMFYGEPGMGKSLMANCFVEESGLECFIIRRNKGDGDFLKEMEDTFNKAKEKAPAIILLDDMDKFSNEDYGKRDSEEYVAVQAGIDAVKDSKVFVVATVNDENKLPNSLIRAGRFDRKYSMNGLEGEDAVKLAKHFLKDVRLDENVMIEDVVKLVENNSSSTYETVINEAAIRAAYLKKEKISIEDLIYVTMAMNHKVKIDSHGKDISSAEKDQIEKMAIHEAGHVVIAETIQPGSVAYAFVCINEIAEGCTKAKKLKDEAKIIMDMAGKAAYEEKYAAHDRGCYNDTRMAIRRIECDMISGMHGLDKVNVMDMIGERCTEQKRGVIETEIRTQLEEYMRRARFILSANRDFLEAVTKALEEKQFLLYSEIQELRSKYETKAAN